MKFSYPLLLSILLLSCNKPDESQNDDQILPQIECDMANFSLENDVIAPGSINHSEALKVTIKSVCSDWSPHSVGIEPVDGSTLPIWDLSAECDSENNCIFEFDIKRRSGDYLISDIDFLNKSNTPKNFSVASELAQYRFPKSPENEIEGIFFQIINDDELDEEKPEVADFIINEFDQKNDTISIDIKLDNEEESIVIERVRFKSGRRTALRKVTKQIDGVREGYARFLLSDIRQIVICDSEAVIENFIVVDRSFNFTVAQADWAFQYECDQ